MVIKACDSCIDPSENKGEKIRSNDERLFNWFKELVREYLQVDIQELNQTVDSNLYIHSIYLHWISRLLFNLDYYFLKNRNSTLHFEGFKLYRDDYFQIINLQLFSHIISFLKMVREEYSIPRETIKKLIAIYQVVSFKKTVKLKKIKSEFIFEIDDGIKYYEDNFQVKLADEIKLYYEKKVNDWSNLNILAYVEQAVQSLQKEEEIAKYFYSKSQKFIINRIEQIIIQQQIEVLTNNEQLDIYSMLKEKRKNEMKHLYQFFKRTDESLNHMTKKFNQYIIYHGNSFNEQCESLRIEGYTQKEIAIEYVQNVFQLKKEIDHLMQYVFDQNITMQNARDVAFLTFLNKNDKSTLLLATYADIILKKQSLQNEQEIEDRVLEIAGIFVYFYSKDAFFKHFQKFFSNHLLNATSRNKQVEKSLIGKFKTEVGYSGVNKIETMLKDIQYSEEFNQDNRSYLIYLGLEMNVNVLRAGSWPIANTKEKCSTPQILKPQIDQFEKLYKNKYKGRNLNWVYSQGSAEIQFQGKEKYFLIVNTYQMVALLTIQSEGSCLNYSKLLEISGIPETELEFILMPFIKLKILNKSDEGDKISNNSDLSVNTQFTNKLKKIKCIPGGKQAQLKKQNEDDKGRNQLVDEMNRERQLIVDACIVRIMKSRKKMKVNELFPEVIKLINTFKPEITLIKKRIVSLLDSDNIKRGSSDLNTLIYVP